MNNPGVIPNAAVQPVAQQPAPAGAAPAAPASPAPAPQGNDPTASPFVAAAMAIMGLNQGMAKDAATIPDTPAAPNKQASGAAAFGNAAKAAQNKMR